MSGLDAIMAATRVVDGMHGVPDPNDLNDHAPSATAALQAVHLVDAYKILKRCEGTEYASREIFLKVWSGSGLVNVVGKPGVGILLTKMSMASAQSLYLHPSTGFISARRGITKPRSLAVRRDAAPC